MHFEFFDGLMPWLILMVRGWYFHHDVMDSLDTQFSGPCDSDELTMQD